MFIRFRIFRNQLPKLEIRKAICSLSFVNWTEYITYRGYGFIHPIC